MASKTPKTLRLSDDIIRLIEEQPGENFTEKFELLVMKCIQELPEAEARLKTLEKQIKAKQQLMAEASSRYARMINQLGTLEKKMYDLDFAIGRALDEWPKE